MLLNIHNLPFFITVNLDSVAFCEILSVNIKSNYRQSGP